MRMSFRFALCALAGFFWTGCASHPKATYHPGEEDPPEFMTGPISVLLTNLDGYSARVTVSTPQAEGADRTVTGDFLEREGRMIFQPDVGLKGKRARAASGMMFMWDANRHSGFVLNDPLQAYAPVSSRYLPTNVVIDPGSAREELIDGHPCRRVEVTVLSAEDAPSRFLVWQDEDAKHFPIRIQSASRLRPTTVSFSDLRIELPSAELFAPPDGYTLYASGVELMNELILRQTSLATRTEHSLDDEPDRGSRLENWRPAQPQ